MLQLKGAFIRNLVENTKVGVTEIYINTHYLHKKVENFILNSRFKDIVTLGYEKKLRGTAGTLLDNIVFLRRRWFSNSC